MLFTVNNEQVERVAGVMVDDMPAMQNEAVTFHEVLRAP